MATQVERMLPLGQRLWYGLTPKVLDGTTLTLPDTRKNQRAYPRSRSQKPGCGFPLLKLVGIFSLSSGVLLDYAKGNKHQHELALVSQLPDLFKPRDLVVADRGFSSYVLIAWLQLRGAFSLFRLHQARSGDLRQGQRLGKRDRLFTWRKPQQLVAELLEVIAGDRIPDRPGRREPRAVKRRPKPYPLLNQPHRRFKEIAHRNRYRKMNPQKSKGLI